MSITGTPAVPLMIGKLAVFPDSSSFMVIVRFEPLSVILSRPPLGVAALAAFRSISWCECTIHAPTVQSKQHYVNTFSMRKRVSSLPNKAATSNKLGEASNPVRAARRG